MQNTSKSKGIKKTTVVKSLSVLSCLAFVLFISAGSFQTSVSMCKQSNLTAPSSDSVLPVNIECAAAGKEVSWITWLTSKSNSNQFHFLDLLELLSRKNSDNE